MQIIVHIATTGSEELDRICAIAFLEKNNEEILVHYELINEGKKILPEASVVHTITNKSIQGKSTFEKSQSYQLLKKYEAEEVTLVAHDFLYVSEMFRRVNYHYKGAFIDTQRVAKHSIEESQNYSLAFLFYELRLYETLEQWMKTYNTLELQHPEKTVEKALYTQLLLEYFEEDLESERMMEMSCSNVLLQKMNFGKYKGYYLEDLAMNDKKYLEWVLQNVENLDADMKYSIEHYLKEYV